MIIIGLASALLTLVISQLLFDDWDERHYHREKVVMNVIIYFSIFILLLGATH